VEICSKTLTVLGTDGYAPHFAIINRAGRNASD
jgi:arsenite methyltransferase